MLRSQINRAYRDALACFARHHWVLPPNPQWDITDFGLGDFERHGLTLINLAAEPEYCEKLMYARRGQTTPCHTHAKKKEDIICRAGELTLALNAQRPTSNIQHPPLEIPITVSVNGIPMTLPASQLLVLPAGHRVTLTPGIWHAFWPTSDECIIGEVSTANDDVNDNLFLDPAVGRYPGIDEDEPAAIRLLSEK
ncbi:D-lyxose/D-mannose family sugar isomerase [Geminisphaera colitermitum]|uniref:D-lyxose/D-mannose family sugar isomerase n=1 Tax=Geminisphaera colitermitum TaxID=1148786 RepID=UPI0001964F6F|nr:D-lyxose/D-mannose family sugar isomerase [Geminisphaera colitermitum]